MNNQSSPEAPKAPVAVLALRTVRPGLGERFEAELHDFISQSLQTEGQLGVSVIQPVRESGSREYGILRRFRDSSSRGC
jgi:quinol monooxygenase YgiN